MDAINRLGQKYTFRRFAPGQYVSGKWRDGEEIIPHDDQGNEIFFSMTAVIQRMSPQETLTLPEGDRTREWIKIYTSTKLERSNEAEKTKGDIVNYKNREYEVRKVEDWEEFRLPHYRVIAILLEN